MSSAKRCSGTNAQGEPCGVRPSFVGPDGYCPAHRKGGRERMRKLAHKGGVKAHEPKGLDPEELPPLTSADAAETWCDVVGRAAVTGRIGHNEAKAALRAVREWRESHEAGAVSEKLEALTDALAEWRKTGDPAPVLQLVDGGES